MRTGSILRGLAAALVATAVFLALAEIGLRFYLSRHILYDVEMSRYAQLLKLESPNPEIGHVHRPGAHARLMGVDVQINSDGLRDVDRNTWLAIGGILLVLAFLTRRKR